MQFEEADVEKRFEAFEYDYISIPDTDDFAFPAGSIVIAINCDDRGIVELMREQQTLDDFLCGGYCG